MMRRTRIIAAKIGDGGLLERIVELFGGKEALQGFITTFLTAWISGCAIPVSGKDAKRMADEEFDGTDYNRRFLRRATRTVRQEARRQRIDLTPAEMETLAISGLDYIRTGDEEEMTIAIHEHANR